MPGDENLGADSVVRESPSRKPPTNINLNKLFLTLLIGKMLTSRRFVHHEPTKGAAAEQNWLAMLNAYLPQRYKADSAFVVDSRGKLSEQIDIVIYDRQYSPLISARWSVIRSGRECVRRI